MVQIVNECCDCATEGYPCLGSSCSRRHVKHYICDKCKEEFEPEALYLIEDEHLCAECALNDYPTLAQIEED